ncbi:MAG: hypothetical protein IIY55_11735 [Blautia sp.]|nr:hypothetical protein [Blautia sp.]
MTGKTWTEPEKTRAEPGRTRKDWSDPGRTRKDRKDPDRAGKTRKNTGKTWYKTGAEKAG